MLIGLDKNELVEFKSTKDQGENATVFCIGNITNREKLRLTRVMKQAMTEKGEIAVEKIDTDEIFKIFKLGVRKIKNYQVAGEVKAEITEISDDLVDNLDIQVLMEVVAKVLEANFPTEKETKNS